MTVFSFDNVSKNGVMAFGIVIIDDRKNDFPETSLKLRLTEDFGKQRRGDCRIAAECSAAEKRSEPFSPIIGFRLIALCIFYIFPDFMTICN